MKSAVIVFPGSNRERDMAHALKLVSGREPAMVWHAEPELPPGTDLVVLPGGFSYGDYLRCGAIAARAPIMGPVRDHARKGGLVMGVCNGFQILCEAGLLPGALLPNKDLRFVCRQVDLEVQTAATPFTSTCDVGQRLSIPAKHTTGCFFGEVPAEQVVLRYAEGHNFNGSQDDIAGVTNEQGNVMGLMPHPEHAVDVLTGGSADGLKLFEGMARVVAV
jgi:phosphoribosylformylglycinamidine synthase